MNNNSTGSNHQVSDGSPAPGDKKSSRANNKRNIDIFFILLSAKYNLSTGLQ
jgi:hypothetical protein